MSNQATEIAPEKMEAYRAYRPMALPEFISVLQSFDGHRQCFDAMGNAALAAGAERAWVQDAILVAAMPAPNGLQAEEKCRCLQGAVDEWVLASPRAGEHVACVAMIMAAVAVESERWGLTVERTRKLQ